MNNVGNGDEKYEEEGEEKCWERVRFHIALSLFLFFFFGLRLGGLCSFG